ncbi:hypothetical protein [Stenotrophomonas acidaminiphila]|uniref:hypothetical protein n=1 Tax=Stenotrophomonas acidaminiphila TaxID=128780 RepID=UPI0028AEF1FF|nr:hypothetical protein [Stenotrophomonas acidaminiphila]
MDETTRWNFQRLQGRISAMDVMLLELMKAVPNGRTAAASGATSISAVAEGLEAEGNENLAFIAAGMREYLADFMGQLDT